eukprot:scaffold762_cov363-Pavlova_lutheri.AAC.13
MAVEGKDSSPIAHVHIRHFLKSDYRSDSIRTKRVRIATLRPHAIGGHSGGSKIRLVRAKNNET